MAFCASCGTQMADDAAFCPNCGKPAAPASGGGASASPTPAPPASYGSTGTPAAPLAENLAGMFAYFTFIPAVIFLLVEPYNRNRFVRFHAFQSLFFHVGVVLLEIALMILGAILHIIPVIGSLFALVVWPVVWLGVFGLWLLLVIKAYQHLMFKLPIVGDMAETQANL